MWKNTHESVNITEIRGGSCEVELVGMSPIVIMPWAEHVLEVIA
jgi:hypothetical protein